MANVEKILIDKSGLGLGLRGAGGVIKIYTRTTPLFKKGEKTNTIYNSSVSPIAFQKPKEYYAPKYSSYLNNTFEKYGVIFWAPNVNLKNNEAQMFKILNTHTKNITIFIEGITDSGQLISQKKTIQVQ